MLTSKQRSYLKGLANNIEVVVQVGKSGITPELTLSVDEVLEKRELIKISVLNNCELEAAEVAETLSGRTRSETVVTVGKKVVLYRQSKTNCKIKLPNAD